MSSDRSKFSRQKTHTTRQGDPRKPNDTKFGF